MTTPRSGPCVAARVIFVLAALLCLGALAPWGAQKVHAEQRRTLLISGPPFPTGWMYLEDGSVGGIRLDFFDKVATHAGFDWRGELYPAKRLMGFLVSGEVDLSMLVKNPLLDKPEILTGSEPVYTENLNVYGPEGSAPVAYRSDLKGKRVVVMRGYGYGGFRNWLDDPANEVELFEVDTFQQAISVLILRDMDYALLYDLNFESGLNALAIEDKEALLEAARAFTITAWSSVPVYFHLSRKALPDAEEVMARLMASFRALREAGEVPPVEVVDMPGDRPE